MKPKKILLPGSIVVLSVFLLAAFQNCAPVNFKGDEEVLLPSSAEPLTEEKVLEIPVTNEIVSSPFKVLLIVDNSASMQASQEKMVSNLDSLLDTLEGKDVEVGITTTSPGLAYVVKHSVVREGKLTDVQMIGGNIVQLISPSLSEILDKSRIEIRRLGDAYFNGNAPIVKAKAFTRGAVPFRSALSSQKPQSFIEFKQKIKNHILSLGMKGADTEVGLCPILQQLQLANMPFAEGMNVFFKKNDKTAIVVLTNEDDSSLLKNCLLKSYEFDVSIKAQKIKDYLVDVRGLQIVVSNIKRTVEKFEVKSDGKVIQSPSLTTDVLNNIESLVSLKDVPYDSSCTQKAQLYLRNRKSHITYPNPSTRETLDLSQVTVSACKLGPVVTYLERSVPESDMDFTRNLCSVGVKDQRGEVIKEKIETGGISFDVRQTATVNGSKIVYSGHIPGRYFSFIKNVTPFYVGCGVQERTIADSSLMTAINQKEYSHISDSKDIEDSIMELSEVNFKGDYLYSFIVNTDECKNNLDSTESLGQRYLEFAQKHPDKVSVHSICAESYRPALEKVSQFIQEKISSTYNLGLKEEIKQLKKVFVNDRPLLPQDYELIDGELKINKSVSLKEGDKITVAYQGQK